MSIPLLLVSDAPNLSSGLARITRDLAFRIKEALPEFELAQLGWDWNDFNPYPWPVHRIRDTDNWGRGDLPEVWWKCFGKRRGVVLSIWDPARCFSLLEDAGEVPAQLWGYFPLDGVNIHGLLGGPAAAAVRRYRRVLGYGEFGAQVLQNVLGGGNVAWLPHGLDLGVFHPRRQQEGLVGVVATNTPRKDWALAFQAFVKMREAMPRLRLWCHISREVTQAWSIPELADQCGLGGNELIVTGCERDGLSGELGDDALANMYSACVVTLGIGMGEGFGYPLCFTAGTVVETKYGPKNIENIQVGDYVTTHRGRFRRVTKTFVRPYTGELQVIKPYYTEPIYATPEHPFLLGGAWWIKAAEIRLDDKVTVPLGHEIPETPLNHLDLAVHCGLRPSISCDEKHIWHKMGYSGKTSKLKKYNRCIPIDADFCRLLGLYVAEGSVGAGNGQVSWAFHAKEEEYVSFVEQQVKRLFGVEAKRRYKPHYPGVEVGFAGTLIGEWLVSLTGADSTVKRVPSFIYQLPAPLIEAFLMGLFQGDGSGKGYGLSLTTSSTQLAEGVRILFRRMGYVASVKHRTRQWNGKPRNESTVQMLGEISRDFTARFNMINRDFRTSDRVTPPKWAITRDEAALTIEIRGLEKVDYSGNVYNFEVEEDNSYLANGIAVHNCESLACGRPVIHCDYAGGADLVPEARWRVKEKIMHVESAYALKRPILDPSEFADAALGAADWVLREESVASAFCAGAVRHLGWDVLWPRWEAWFRQGLRELE